MTYADYLDNWESNFGDADTGEYGYWRAGKHFPVIVNRLSQADFDEHFAALQAASKKFESAFAAHDDVAMRTSLAESFPHELALVI